MKRSKVHIILILIALFTCCKQQGEKSSTLFKPANLAEEQVETPAQPITIPENVDKDFGLFIENFNNNASFQSSRVQFPLKAELLDEDLSNLVHKKILEKDYQTLFLSLKESNDFTVELIKKMEEVNIEYSGKENGIASSYTFKKIAGKWMLVELIDLST